MCGAKRCEGERGVCGAGADMLVARAALHFWEEPPLSGERGSGAVFFSNCSLRCSYCQNAAIAAGEAGIAVSVERLADILLEQQERGALNINFVTPTHYELRIIDAVARARARGLRIPIVWNTSSYETVPAVRALAGTVDVYLADFKYASAETARAFSHAADYPQVALAAIDEMVHQVGKPQTDEVDCAPRMTRGVIVRHLILPGHIDESKRAIALLYERYGDDVALSIMNQYTPLLVDEAHAGQAWAASVLKRYPELAERVSDEEYDDVLDFADELGIEDYFWQEGPAAEESFIPVWDGTGVLPSE